MYFLMIYASGVLKSGTALMLLADAQALQVAIQSSGAYTATLHSSDGKVYQPPAT